MFLAATNQYAHIKNKFNSFDTEKNYKKIPKSIIVVKNKTKLTPNSPSITSGPLRENYGTPRENYGTA